jgi:hypothetical protein
MSDDKYMYEVRVPWSAMNMAISGQHLNILELRTKQQRVLR